MRELKTILIDDKEYLDQLPQDAVRKAELIVRLMKDNPHALELVKSRYTAKGVYRLVELDEGDKEAEISARVVDLENELETLYGKRKGKMVDNDWGWCVGCGKVKVCATDGDDTCGDCLANS